MRSLLDVLVTLLFYFSNNMFLAVRKFNNVFSGYPFNIPLSAQRASKFGTESHGDASRQWLCRSTCLGNKVIIFFSHNCRYLEFPINSLLQEM